MPLFMPRPSPSWIVILVSLGGMLPAARAADPPCPTQVVPAGAPPAAAGGAPQPQPLRRGGENSPPTDPAKPGAAEQQSTPLQSPHNPKLHARFFFEKKKKH